ncbi:MAG: hypothetical protein ACLQVX_09230 [Limisphaerales bacterium]
MTVRSILPSSKALFTPAIRKHLTLRLRGKGLKSRNALHALRKELGSQICAQAGIYAASSALRHSSINITREYDIDRKQPVVFQVSKLLDARAVPASKEGQA